MKKITLAIFLLQTVLSFEQSPAIDNPSNQNDKIDRYIHDLMARQGIPGVALAVIKDDRIFHKNNYGYANLEHQVPISDQSIFRVYSLTKPIVAVGIFQLVEEGKLRLKDKISKYVPDLPKAWQSIRIKHLLSHSSGIPDMAPIPEFKELSEQAASAKVFAQDCKFKPGEQYDYNQTGFWLLKKVIEKIEGTEFSRWITEQQFQAPCDTAFFSSDSRDIVLHRVTPYFPFTKRTLTIDHSYLQGTYAHAQNGLNISLNEFIKWNDRLNHDKFLDQKTKATMWQPYPYTNSNKVFTYGWDQRVVNGQVSYGFSGSLVTAYRIFPGKNLSIIFLSNGLTQFYDIEKVINDLAGLVMTTD